MRRWVSPSPHRPRGPAPGRLPSGRGCRASADESSTVQRSQGTSVSALGCFLLEVAVGHTAWLPTYGCVCWQPSQSGHSGVSGCWSSDDLIHLRAYAEHLIRSFGSHHRLLASLQSNGGPCKLCDQDSKPKARKKQDLLSIECKKVQHRDETVLRVEHELVNLLYTLNLVLLAEENGLCHVALPQKVEHLRADTGLDGEHRVFNSNPREPHACWFGPSIPSKSRCVTLGHASIHNIQHLCAHRTLTVRMSHNLREPGCGVGGSVPLSL